MIFDVIENANQYSGIHAGIDKVLSTVTNYTAENFAKEVVKLDGDNLFMIFPEYETHTRSDSITEAHRKYIDVMYMVEGEETIYVKPTSQLKNITMPYDAEQDALLADTDDDAMPILLKAGSFVVLFPQDAHAPSCDVTSTHSKVKKIIGKVAI